MKILVVIDMQNDFTSGVLGNTECEKAVSKVVDVINENNYDNIFLTRDTHQKNYLETQEGKNLPVEHCIEGTEGWQIRKEIMVVVNDSNKPFQIINKPTFGSVTLAETIKTMYEQSHENMEIDIVGVCTGICVISNAIIIKSFNPELPINVIEKATACVTPQSKKTAIEAMKLLQINIK